MNDLNWIADTVSGVLVSLTWQICLLVALLWGVTTLCRKASASFRYGLWCIVLVRLCLPMELATPFGFAGTVWSSLSGCLSALGGQFQSQAPVLIDINWDQPVALQPYPLEKPFPSFTPHIPVVVSGSVTLPDTTEVHQVNSIFLVWLAWVILFIGLVVYRTLRVWILLRKCPQVDRPGLQESFRTLVKDLRIKQNVTLHSTKATHISGPAVVGILHPKILLPVQTAQSWGIEEIEPILVHELAHVKRGDLLVNWLQMIVQVVYFFHPLVWYANWKIRQEREMACDDLALEHLSHGRKVYCESILRTIESARHTPFSPTFVGVGLSEHSSSIGRRILRIMHGNTVLRPKLALSSLVLLFFLAIGSVVLAGENSTQGVKDSSEVTISSQSQETPGVPNMSANPNASGPEEAAEDTLDSEKWRNHTGISEALSIEKRAFEETDPQQAILSFRTAASRFEGLAKYITFDRNPRIHQQLLQRLLDNAERSGPTHDKEYPDVAAYHSAVWIQYCLDDGHAEGLTYGGKPISYATALDWYLECMRLLKERGEITEQMQWLPPSLLGGQVEVLKSLGRPDEAEPLFKELASKYPDSSPYQKLVLAPAEELYEKHEYTEAIEAYQKIYDQNSKWNASEEALMMIGLCYDRLGDKPKALEAFEKAVETFPEAKGFSESTYFYLGSAYEQNGEKEKAIKAYEKAVELCKDREPYLFPNNEAREQLHKLQSNDPSTSSSNSDNPQESSVQNNPESERPPDNDLYNQVCRLNFGTSTIEDVTQVFGEPESYTCDGQPVEKGNLPDHYIACFKNRTHVCIANNRLIEIRFHEPNFKLHPSDAAVGWELDRVLTALGQPERIETGRHNNYEKGVLYKDIDGNQGQHYYAPTTFPIRLFFLENKVNGLYLTDNPSTSSSNSDITPESSIRNNPESEQLPEKDLFGQVSQLNFGASILSDVTKVFGEPESCIWEDQTFEKGKLPDRYLAHYSNQMDVLMIDNHLVEVRFYEPDFQLYLFNIAVGWELERVLMVLGKPERIVNGGSIEFEKGVLYKDIDGRKGHHYYAPTAYPIRLFFTGEKVSALYVTGNDPQFVALHDAWQFVSAGRFENAYAAIQAIYEKHTDWRYAEDALLLVSGICYKMQGDIDKAIETWETAIGKDPTQKGFTEMTYFHLGEAYTRKGQIQDALIAFRRTVEMCAAGPQGEASSLSKESKEWISMLQAGLAPNKTK